jgi:hypothetical protein
MHDLDYAGTRGINNTLCAATFAQTRSSLLAACSAVNVADAQLAAIGQTACANATSAVLAGLSPDCFAAGFVAGSAQASSNSSACVAAFTPFVGVLAIPVATVPAALKAVDAACPAPASAKTAEATHDEVEDTLFQAQITGTTLAALDKATTSFTQSLKNATALTPSLANCQSSLSLAQSSTNAGCGILFIPPELDGQVIQACGVAAASQLSIAETGCGSLADAQKTHADAVLAGVQQGSNVTCNTASENARFLFQQSCDNIANGFVNNTLVNNATCQAAQATALGILSAPCISNQTVPA